MCTFHQEAICFTFCEGGFDEQQKMALFGDDSFFFII